MTEHIIPRKKNLFYIRHILAVTGTGQIMLRTGKGGVRVGKKCRKGLQVGIKPRTAAGDHGHMRCMVHQVT